MEISFSILGATIGLIALLLPAQSWKRRLVHMLLSIIIVVLAYFTAIYQEKNDRIARIEKTANQIVIYREKQYTDLGFIHAALAFLEKNNDLYPDTYARAVKMCQQYQCDKPSTNAADMVTLTFIMQGILKGLTTTEKNSENS